MFFLSLKTCIEHDCVNFNVYAYSCTKGIAFVSENDLKKFTKMAKQTLEFCISILDRLFWYAL